MAKTKNTTDVADVCSLADSSKAFLNTVKNISSKLGNSEDVRLASQTKTLDALSTGSLLLDQATGGIPRGKMVEIFGLEGSGKTTLALSVARTCQQDNPKNFVVYIDVECAITESLLTMNNIDQERFLIIQPESGEVVFEYIKSFAQTALDHLDNNSKYHIPLLIVDSLAALSPSAELLANMGDMQIGAQARLISKGVRIIKNILSRSKMSVIFINQVRSKVGVIYGNPEVTSGGRAMAFYATIRLRTKAIKSDDPSVHIMQVSVKKNKCRSIADPVILEIKNKRGFDIIGEIMDLAIKERILQQRGSWIFYQEQSLGQGKQKCRDFFIKPENRELLQGIANQSIGSDYKLKPSIFVQ